MFRVALIALLFTAPLNAQPTIADRLATVEQQQVRMEAKVDDILRRIDVMQATIAKLPGMEPPPVARVWPVPSTYGEARQQAIDRGLPLVVWSGTGICPACIKTTTADGSLVSWIGPVPQFSSLSSTADALIVALPNGGELWHIATLTQWDAKGHVGSIKEAIQQFRASRQIIRQDRVGAAYSSTTTGYATYSSRSIGVCRT